MMIVTVEFDAAADARSGERRFEDSGVELWIDIALRAWDAHVKFYSA